jgi:ketosteroid isomerase-like protein
VGKYVKELLLSTQACRQASFGRDGFPVGFSAAHRRLLIRCISELEEVVIVGEVGCTLCSDSLSITPRAGGAATELAGHRMTIYRKQPDGRWLLARDANTLSAKNGKE